MKISEYSTLDATGVAELVRNKEVSPGEVLETAIQALEQVNPKLNAVVDYTYDYARKQIEAGIDLSAPFCGVPFVIKDSGDFMAGIRATLGTRLAGDGFYASVDTELARRFKKAGVVVIATASCPEFCWNNCTETLRNGITRNPWNPNLTSGGSSGGTAALVAAGAVPIGHGSDGGGSIRMPASACGLVGLKPSRFRIPTGPDGGDPGHAAHFVLTRSVRDTAIMLDAVAGDDPGAYGSARLPDKPYSEIIKKDPGKLKIAYMLHHPYGDEFENEECVRAVKETVALLESLGHECVEAYPPLSITYHEPRILVQAVGTNLWIEDVARRSGLPINETTLEPLVYKQYLEAQKIPATAYAAANKELAKAARRVGRFMEDFDILLSPTMGILPLEVNKYNPYTDPNKSVNDWVLTRRRFSGNTALCNVTGMPSLTIPLCSSADGLPIGIEIDAKLGCEDTVLALAAQLERAKPWSDRLPGIFAR